MGGNYYVVLDVLKIVKKQCDGKKMIILDREINNISSCLFIFFSFWKTLFWTGEGDWFFTG